MNFLPVHSTHSSLSGSEKLPLSSFPEFNLGDGRPLSICDTTASAPSDREGSFAAACSAGREAFRDPRPGTARVCRTLKGDAALARYKLPLTTMNGAALKKLETLSLWGLLAFRPPYCRCLDSDDCRTRHRDHGQPTPQSARTAPERHGQTIWGCSESRGWPRCRLPLSQGIWFPTPTLSDSARRTRNRGAIQLTPSDLTAPI